MIVGRNLAKSNSLWQLVYSMNFRRSTYMYSQQKDVLFKTDKNRWCRLVQGFFLHSSVPKKSLQLRCQKHYYTKIYSLCCEFYFAIFWKLELCLFGLLNCGLYSCTFSYPICLFVGLV